jgi:adenosyl cobinamide kinase/adenosyl cobinamide phosphate guanylyltransferase
VIALEAEGATTKIEVICDELLVAFQNAIKATKHHGLGLAAKSKMERRFRTECGHLHGLGLVAACDPPHPLPS